MPSVINRPFFSFDVIVITAAVLVLAWLASQWLATALYRLLF